MKNKILTAGICLTLGAATVFAQKNLQNNSSANKELLPGITKLILGGGYSSDKKDAIAVAKPVMNTEDCSIDGSSSTVIDLKHCENSSEFAFQLGVSLDILDSSVIQNQNLYNINNEENDNDKPPATTHLVIQDDKDIDLSGITPNSSGEYAINVLDNDTCTSSDGTLQEISLLGATAVSGCTVTNDNMTVYITPGAGFKQSHKTMNATYTAKSKDGKTGSGNIECLFKGGVDPVDPDKNKLKANDDSFIAADVTKDEDYYLLDVLDNDDNADTATICEITDKVNATTEIVDNSRKVKVKPNNTSSLKSLSFVYKISKDDDTDTAKVTLNYSEQAVKPVAKDLTFNLKTMTPTSGAYILSDIPGKCSGGTGIKLTTVSCTSSNAASVTVINDGKDISLTPKEDCKSNIILNYQIQNDDQLKDTGTITCSPPESSHPVSPDSKINSIVSFLLKNQKYSENLYYMEKVQLPTKTVTAYGENGLTDFGKEYYAQGPDKFREVCGDKFVQQITYGAVLCVVYKINFNSYADKVKFEINIPAADKAIIGVPDWLNKQGINGNIELTAFQLGGDSTNLAKIFNSDPKNSYYTINTDIKNAPEYFKNLTGQILGYAANDFSQQIGFDPSSQKFIGNVVPIDYNLVHFNDIGLNVGESIVTQEIKNKRQEINSYYYCEKSYVSEIKHMLDSKITALMPVEIKSKLAFYANLLDLDIATLDDPEEGIPMIYDHPEKTLQLWNNFISNSEAYQTMDIIKGISDFYKTAYKLSVKGYDYIFYPLSFENKSYIVSNDINFGKYSFGQVTFSSDKNSVDIYTEKGKDGIVIEHETLKKNIGGSYDGKIKVDGSIFKKDAILNIIENPI